jgi:hypothetical protein
VDAEDRAMLSRHLVLSELRKAARLVESLQARRSQSDLFVMLANRLKAELARTIHEAKSVSADADDCSSMPSTAIIDGALL